MRRLDKLNDSDLLDIEKHFPVQVVFNDLYIEDFLDTVENYLSEGQGFGVNYGDCSFPDDLDEYDIETRGTFEGVEFGLHSGTEVLLDYKTFYYYLEKVCNRYCEDFPENKQAMEKALEKFRLRFLVD